jgi:predicted RNase H-like nuclease (RuvC/YqgF family)
LLEKQEDLFYEEHDKVVEIEKSVALEVEKNERLVCDLSSCHATISSFRNENNYLNARIEKLNATSWSLEHVFVWNRCKDIGIDACNDHDSTIAKLNDKIVRLNVQLKTCKNEVEKVKFARDAYTISRHPSIKDGLGFQKGTKDTKSQKAVNFTRDTTTHVAF